MKHSEISKHKPSRLYKEIFTKFNHLSQVGIKFPDRKSRKEMVT